MIATTDIILIGVLGIVALAVFFFSILLLSRHRTPAGISVDNETTKEEKEGIPKRLEMKRPPHYEMIKDYYLTYLECCYDAFITIFIGILAVPVLPIPNILLKLVTVCIFWFVGGYYLAQIIYTYGQLRVIFGYTDIDDVISEDGEKLGFPFNLLEKVFKYARKPVYGRANIKYLIIGFGYLGLLGIILIACLNL